MQLNFATVPMVEFEIAEGDKDKSTPVVEANSTPDEAEHATTNPYLSTALPSEPAAADEESGFGARPILYLCLIIYLALSTYLKSGGQQDPAPTKHASSSSSQHPNINGAYDDDNDDNEEDESGGDDDDDEFGDFEDAEGVSVRKSPGKRPPSATSDTEYTTSSTVSSGISMHKVKVLFCTA